MKRSAALLAEHPVNRRRVSEGKRPANSLWLWGAGTKPALPPFERKTGLKGGMISAVDLLKGIGKLAGMRVIDVPGATGNYDTDFIGKANACADALLSGLDFVYLHMEAPDECGHQGDVAHKIYAAIACLRRAKRSACCSCPTTPRPLRCERTRATQSPISYTILPARQKAPSLTTKTPPPRQGASSPKEGTYSNFLSRDKK